MAQRRAWVEVTTGAGELLRLRESRPFWETRLRRFALLSRLPIVGRLALPRWQQAWREVWHRDNVERAVLHEGADNLSGMDYDILALGVPDAPERPSR